MLSISPKYSHPTLRNIFSSPTSPIPYEVAPEVANVQVFPADRLSQVRDVELRRLGKQPIRVIYRSPLNAPEDFRIYELRDVLMCRGVLYSRDGRFFQDCCRRFYSIDENNPTNLIFSAYRAERLLYPSAPAGSRYPEYMKSIGNGRYAPSRPRNPNPELVESDCYYFHNDSVHFGHFLVYTTPKLWAVDEVCKNGNIRLWHAWKPMRGVSPDLLTTVHPYGFTEKDFLTTPEISIFKKIYLATDTFRPDTFISEKVLEIYRRIAEYYAPRPEPAAPKRIYISRRGDGNRALVNEDMCERAFMQRGFTIIHPEQLSWSEQMQLFCHATHIAGCVGSAMHRRLFARRGQKSLYLAPVRFQHWDNYFATEIAFDGIFNVVLGDCGEESNYPREGKGKISSGEWIIDMEDLEEGLTQWLGE